MTVDDGDANGTSNDFTVAPGPLGSFVFGAIAPQTAGTPSASIAIQAKDTFGNDKTDYSGTPALTGSLGTSTTGCPGPCSPNYDGDGIVPFSGGTASATFTAYVTGTGQTLTLTDSGASVASNSGTFIVNPGPLGSFTIGTITSPKTAGLLFSVGATAYDLYGNVKTDYSGGATPAGTPGSAPGDSTRGCGPPANDIAVLAHLRLPWPLVERRGERKRHFVQGRDRAHRHCDGPQRWEPEDRHERQLHRRPRPARVVHDRHDHQSQDCRPSVFRQAHRV